MKNDKIVIANKKFNSRLIVGTGKYKSMSECAKAIKLSGAEIVTVAVRRVNITDKKKPLLMDYIDPKKITYLPNTAGCFTSEEALREGIEVQTFKTQFSPMKYLFNQEKPKILMKLIVDTKTDKVLGIHMLGQDSPEIIQSLSVALTAGATKKDFDNTTAIHPTSAEEFVTMRK